MNLFLNRVQHDNKMAISTIIVLIGVNWLFIDVSKKNTGTTTKNAIIRSDNDHRTAQRPVRAMVWDTI